MKMLDDLVKKVFDKYPTVKPVYVSTGTKLAFLMAQPLKTLMLHLILVQDLDPNKPHKKMMDALNRLLDRREEKSYDEDFDFSWVKNGYNNVKSVLSKNHPTSQGVTMTDYKKMTDLSRVSDKPVTLPENTATALEATRTALIAQHELHPNFDEGDPKLDARFKQTSEFLKRAKEPAGFQEDAGIISGPLNIASIKEALHTLKKYASDVEGSGKPVDKSPKFKGAFRRNGK